MEKSIHKLWTTGEERILREFYVKPIPLEKIAAMLPGRTVPTIKKRANYIGIKRPPRGRHCGIPEPGWDRIKTILADGPMLVKEIATRDGTSKANVADTLSRHRYEWHVAEWLPPAFKGRHIMKVALGPGEDAKPNRKRPTKQERTHQIANPWLVASGLVTPVSTVKGRVIKHEVPEDLEEFC